MVNGISVIQHNVSELGIVNLPSLILDDGEMTTRRFVEFFTAQIRNKGTRATYANAVFDFCDWCTARNITLQQVEPIVVAGYIEDISRYLAPATVKLRLAAIRMLFDYLVTGHTIVSNPASAVRGPRHIVKKGKTPVLSADLTRELLDSIDIETIGGLRDRALIGLMVFSFARVSAAVSMDFKDYHQQGRRMWFRLREKGGKPHEVPAHHTAEEYLDEYIERAAIAGEPNSPLFRTLGPDKKLSDRRMSRTDALRMVKRRAVAIGLPSDICCHTWRATGITTYLQNGGSLEHAMSIACHESATTTKLYDRTLDEPTLDEIERIRI